MQSDMIIFNEQFMPAISETIHQMVDAFNASSGGAIQLVNATNIGDTMATSFYNLLASAQRRVDRYTANVPATPTNLAQYKHTAVKVAGGFGPIVFEPAQMTWLRKPTAEGIEMISRQFAQLYLQDQLNTVIRALVAAISNQANLTKDVSGGASITQSVLNASHRKFGDMSTSLVTSVMTGSMYHQLIGQNLANAQELFSAGNVTVVNILGKNVIVTDSPSLTEAGTPNKDKVLSLTVGAGIVRDPADPITNIQTDNGKLRIETSVQMDYDFTVDLKGFSWANGAPVSPSDADIGTGANWTLDVANVKAAAGVIAIGDEAA